MSRTKAGLTPMEFRTRFGKEITVKVCTDAGTSYAYFKNICNERRRPGVDLARKLVAASGNRISLEALLIAKTSIRPVGAPPLAAVSVSPLALHEVRA